MREPSREENAFARLRGKRNTFPGIVQLRHRIPQKWGKHHRQATTRIKELKVPAAAAFSRDVPRVYIINP